MTMGSAQPVPVWTIVACLAGSVCAVAALLHGGRVLLNLIHSRPGARSRCPDGQAAPALSLEPNHRHDLEMGNLSTTSSQSTQYSNRASLSTGASDLTGAMQLPTRPPRAHVPSASATQIQETVDGLADNGLRCSLAQQSKTPSRSALQAEMHQVSPKEFYGGSRNIDATSLAGSHETTGGNTVEVETLSEAGTAKPPTEAHGAPVSLSEARDQEHHRSHPGVPAVEVGRPLGGAAEPMDE